MIGYSSFQYYEWQTLKSQIVTSRFTEATSEWGGRRTLPYVFTEQGVAMLSSVLNSPQSIQVNISIMRVFVKIRQWACNYDELARRIEELHEAQGEQSHHIAVIIRSSKSLSDRK
ncbi:MAG TPA: ORF6N domain-containing protein [Bacteroidales bacterium]|nr:ORF6N domain-containing protein [Bacteroidales bacterium]HRZ47763.1 ORF6N domain-containing protein [Bacteroidales bacterium]